MLKFHCFISDTQKLDVFFIIMFCREEQEKLNVWVAYLNLENMYGSHESLIQLFERALKHNEPIKIFQQLIDIYVTSGKIDVSILA